MSYTQQDRLEQMRDQLVWAQQSPDHAAQWIRAYHPDVAELVASSFSGRKHGSQPSNTGSIPVDATIEQIVEDLVNKFPWNPDAR